jgi:lysophospholipase L1-like esterase
MEPRHMHARRISLVAVATLLLAACWGDLVVNDSIGTPHPPAAGPMFARYVAIGTSIGAGIQSGGINDSTQKQTYVYLLARAMGLRPGVDWSYPAFTIPGCPPPYTNPLTGARVTPAGFPTSTGASCYVRRAASAAPVMNNVSIPGIRIQQVLALTAIPFGPTDTLKLAQFVTGGVNPIDMAERAQPTFVTLEAFANDALGAATRGDTTLLTPLADFQAAFTAIADRLDATGAQVAVMNLPTSLLIPHFSAGQVFFVLKNVTPTPPFSLATFTVDASCAPSALGGVGDSTFLPFSTTATIAGAITTAGVTNVNLNCATGAATITTPLGTSSAGATIVKPELKAILARLVQYNTVIATEAAARGWALADWNSALLQQAAVGQIPPFPSLTTPTTTLFGPIFSLDGIHPNAVGQRIIAQAFADAIAQKFGVTLVIP